MKLIETDAAVQEAERSPIRPNMLVLSARAVSSTFAKTDFSHCLVTKANFFNSRFHESSLEGVAFDNCDLDGSVFTGCSFRAVELVNCDIDKLIVNGINVGDLFRFLTHGQKGGQQ